ncbi:MAG: DUF371 domain-containing protein [Promethearchaeati archaeon SRVP18_Atabeyarchaeia-1]
MKAIECLTAYGHSCIRGTHGTTLEITKAEEVTLKGDCIIAANASKSPSDFSNLFKNLLRRESSKVLLVLEVCGLKEEVTGQGDPQLRLTSREDMVCRKSSFTCERTLMVRANKAAKDLDRRIIERLRNPENKVSIELLVESE